MREDNWKYRAFISYCHADRRLAEELHRDLEAFIVPRGVIAASGGDEINVPRKLGKIFFDRYELVAAHISRQITQGLEKSESLIVVCSRNSASSEAVAREIQYFIGLGRQDRIFPIIIDGEPDARVRQLVPPIIRSIKTDDEDVTGAKVSLLAADAREHADGWHLAQQKLVAAILGLELDQLRRRAADAERRRRRVWAGVAAGTSSLAVVSVLLAAYAYNQYTRSEALLDRSVQISLDFASTVSQAFAGYQIPSHQASKLLSKLGADLEDLLAETPYRTFDRLLAQGQMKLKQHTAMRRNHSLGDAEQLAQEAKNIFEALQNPAFHAASSIEAPTAAGHAHKSGRRIAVLTGLAESSMALGLIKRDMTWLSYSVDEYKEALKYRSDLVLHHPHLSEKAGRAARSELAEAHYMLAEVLERQNRPVDALKEFATAYRHFTEIEVVTSAIEGVDPELKAEQIQAKLNVSRSQVELAEALSIVGKSKPAFDYFDKAIATRNELIEADPANRKLKRYLAWAHLFRGELHLETGNVSSSIEDFMIAVAFQKEGYDFDPESKQRKKDYIWARGYLGRARLANGEYGDALNDFNEAVKIAKRDAVAYPEELLKRRGYAFWLAYRAKVQRLLGNPAGAMVDLAEAEEQLQPLVGLVDVKYPLAWAEMASIKLEQARVSAALDGTGGLKAAMASLVTARDYLTPLIDKAPGSVVWKRRLAEVEAEAATLTCAIDPRCNGVAFSELH